MNTNEVNAILGYIEFHLLHFVEESERHISDQDVIGDMYDRAYAILADLEVSLDIQLLLGKNRNSAER